MKKQRTKFPVFLTLLCLTLATVSLIVFTDEKKKEQERFTGNVVPPQSLLTMVVDRWTSPEEGQQLYKVLTEEGAEAMFKALRKKTVGHVWFTRSPRLPLNIATTEQTEKGRLIRLVTEHPILPGEIPRPLRSLDDRFGVIEFILNEKGEGEGQVTGRVTVTIYEDGTIGFRPLASIPQMLKTVRSK